MVEFFFLKNIRFCFKSYFVMNFISWEIESLVREIYESDIKVINFRSKIFYLLNLKKKEIVLRF